MLRVLAFLAIVFCVSLPVRGQEQRPRYQPGWPCSGKVDPSHVRTAEATGGKVLLLKPTEITGASEDMSASSGHPETVVRVAGPLDDGVHDFEVPLDSTIESVYFFVSLQCLQHVTLLQPSGDVLPVDAPGVGYHAFDAVRLFTVRVPRPGTWKVSVAGRGFFSLVVTAKTALALADVSLMRDGAAIKGLAPLGKRVQIQAAVSGDPRNPSFRFISMGAELLADVHLEPQEGDAGGTYTAEVTLPQAEFRVLMTGIDRNGFPFLRVTPTLFVGGR